MSALLHKRSHGRRGIATPIALALTAVAAAAMLSVVALLMFDCRRTRQSLIDADLRQLLAAGAEIATARLNDGELSTEKPELSIPLPDSLAKQGAGMQVVLIPVDEKKESGPDQPRRRCRVSAFIGGASAAQLLVYQRVSGTQWRLVEALPENPSLPSSGVPARGSPSDNGKSGQ